MNAASSTPTKAGRKPHPPQRTVVSCRQDLLVEMGLNLNDAAILRYVGKFAECPNMKTVTVDDKVYRWIDYQTLLDELPSLGIGSTKVLGRRFSKYVELGLPKVHDKKYRRCTVVYFYLTPMFYKLYQPYTEPKSAVSDPHTELERVVSSDHTELQSPNTELESPNTELESPNTELESPNTELKSVVHPLSKTLNLDTPDLSRSGEGKRYLDSERAVGAPLTVEKDVEPEGQAISSTASVDVGGDQYPEGDQLMKELGPEGDEEKPRPATPSTVTGSASLPRTDFPPEDDEDEVEVEEDDEEEIFVAAGTGRPPVPPIDWDSVDPDDSFEAKARLLAKAVKSTHSGLLRNILNTFDDITIVPGELVNTWTLVTDVATDASEELIEDIRDYAAAAAPLPVVLEYEDGDGPLRIYTPTTVLQARMKVAR